MKNKQREKSPARMIRVDEDTYQTIARMAEANRRKIGAQVKFVFEQIEKTVNHTQAM